MSTNMRAAVWANQGDHSITLINKPISTPAPHQVLVRIKASSLCHTDHLVTTGLFGTPQEVGLPIVAGHEGVGVIVGLGELAKREGKWAIGDRFGGMLNTGGCGQCGECRYASPRYCSQAKMMGLKGIDGVFAEYALMDKDWLVHLPDEMSYEQAAPLTCAGVTIYAAIKRSNLRSGQIVLISGLGGLGYLGVQIAKAKGLKVVGVDVNPARIKALRRLPDKLRPDLLIDPITMTPGEVDAAIIATDSPSATEYTIPLLATRSTLIITAGPSTLSIPLIPLISKI
ncbi:hypothetical protein IAT40_000298 [Kwoniella sp. CBS 6097]